MIVMLPPDQISQYWPHIQEMAIQTQRLPHNVDQATCNRFLAMFLSSQVHCWVAFTISDGQRFLQALGITSIKLDTVTQEKSLMIESLYAHRPFTDELKEECMAVLAKFAMQNGCATISAQTSNMKAEALMESVGFTTSMRMYTWRL